MDGLSVVLGVMLFLLAAAVAFPAPVKKRKPGLGMPGYRLIYSDTRSGRLGGNAVRSSLLKSEKDGLTGKPDYIYKHICFNQWIPVELKSGEIKNEAMPHKGDLLQLGAYFLIIEAVYGARPRKGRVVYKDAMFIVRNTARLRKEVRTALHAMRGMLKDGNGEENASFTRCRYCVCRGTVCEVYERYER